MVTLWWCFLLEIYCGENSLMELKEFIKTALVDIIEGVQEAKKALNENGACICPFVHTNPSKEGVKSMEKFDHFHGLHHQTVHFDIAVTTENTKTNGGKAGIKVFCFEAGIGGNFDISNATVSKIKFLVPIALKTEKIKQ
jgi:hypothetical protein